MEGLEKLIDSMSLGQKKHLIKLINNNSYMDLSSREIISEISSLHGNFISKFFQSNDSYQDILLSICKKLKININKSVNETHIEQLISQNIMRKIWAKTDSKQKEQLNNEFSKIAEDFGKSKEWMQAGGVGGMVIAAELGGFATFMLATSSLAALTGSIGIVLPFSAYTNLTSAMSLILGPIGWIAIGIFAIYKITGTDFKKLIPIVLFISAVRNEIITKE